MRVTNPKLWRLAAALYSGGKAGAEDRTVELDVVGVPAALLEGMTAMECTMAAAAAASCVFRQWDVARRTMPPYLGLFSSGGNIVVPLDAVCGMSVNDAPCVCDVWTVSGGVCSLAGSVSVVNDGKARGNLLVPDTGMRAPTFSINAPPAWADVPPPRQESDDSDAGDAPGAPPAKRQRRARVDVVADPGASAEPAVATLEVPPGHAYAVAGNPGTADAPRVPLAFLRHDKDAGELPLSDVLDAVLCWGDIASKYGAALVANTEVVTTGLLRALRGSVDDVRKLGDAKFAAVMRGFLPAIFTLTLSVLDAHDASRRHLDPMDTDYEMRLFPAAAVIPPRRGPLAMWVRVVHGIVRRLFSAAATEGAAVMATCASSHRGKGTVSPVGRGVKVKTLATPEERAPWMPPGYDWAQCAPPTVVLKPWSAAPLQYIGDRSLQVDDDGKVCTWVQGGAVVTSDVILLREMAISTALATVNVVLHKARTRWAAGKGVADAPAAHAATWRYFRKDLWPRAQRWAGRFGARMWMQDTDLHRAHGNAYRDRISGLTGGHVVGSVDMGLGQALSVAPPCVLNLMRRATEGRSHLKWTEFTWLQRAMTSIGVPMYGDREPGFWDVLGRANDRENGGAGTDDPRKLGSRAARGIDKRGEEELGKDPKARKAAWCEDAAKVGACPFAGLAVLGDGEWNDTPPVDPWKLKAWLEGALEEWGMPPTPLRWPLFAKRPHGWLDEDDIGNEFMPKGKAPAVLCQHYTQGVQRDGAAVGINPRARTTKDVMASIVAACGAGDEIKAAAAGGEKGAAAAAAAEEDGDGLLASGSDSD